MKRVHLENAEEHAIRGYINEIELLQSLKGHKSIVRLWDHEIDRQSNIIYMVC